MELTPEGINGFLAQHHILPIAAVFVFMRKLIRPLLVDFRAALVYALCIGLAVASKMGVTPEDIERFRPGTEGKVPEVPREPADSGDIRDFLGVPKAKP